MTKASKVRIGELPLDDCRGIGLDAGQRVRCVQGCLWITFEGAPGDVVLLAGQAWTASCEGLLVIQPLAGPARVAFESPSARGGEPLGADGQRLQAGHFA